MCTSVGVWCVSVCIHSVGIRMCVFVCVVCVDIFYELI